MDEGVSLNKCLSSNIQEQAFYNSANRLVYHRLVCMIGEGKPIQLEALAHEFKESHELDAIGGYAYLTQITSSVPTTAQLDYFIEKLVDLHALRETIKHATGLVENCFNYQGGGVAELLSGPVSRLLELSSGSVSKPEPTWPVVVDDAARVLDNLITHRGMPATDIVEWPWPSMNNIFQPMQRGQLVLVAARTSEGKSSFARQVSCNVAQNGLYVYFDTLEVRPVQVALQMASMAARIGLRQVPKAHPGDQADLKAKLMGLKNAGITMSSRDKTLAQVVCRIRALKAAKKVDLAVVDYGGLLLDVASASKDEQIPQISRITKVLKNLAMEENIVIMLLWQLNRANDKEMRQPRKSDLRASGTLEEDADKILLIYRPYQNPITGESQEGKSLDECPSFYQSVIQDKGRDDGTASMEFMFHRSITSFEPIAKLPKATES